VRVVAACYPSFERVGNRGTAVFFPVQYFRF
jgi:hypothetical protein